MQLAIELANLESPSHQAIIVDLLDSYARHPMGSGQPLPAAVKSKLISGLKANPMCRIFLAKLQQEWVGIAICFVGFSTFKAAPLLNIHDLHVRPEVEGRGIGSRLIDAVVEHTQSINGCAVTLEVRRDNPARQLYAKKGFLSADEPLPADAMLFGKRMLV
jgi:ribosomal protein S18 acetylase RimI-like enzyme